jgi:hypothetical protein
MTTNRAVVTGLAVALLATAAIPSANARNTPQNGAPASAKILLVSALVSLAATGTRVVTIADPVFGMTAYTLTIPDNWIFQGDVIQGTSCVPPPLPVFRMSSPDGLTGVKWFPRMDWAWSENPNLPAKSISSDCLPYKNGITASDFLKYMINILKFEYVKDLPAKNLEALQKTAVANNTKLMTNTVDAADFQVRYHINQIEIEEHVNAVVMCSTDKTSAKATEHTCSATLGRSWAPQGQWSEGTFVFTQHSLAIDEKWNSILYWYAHRTSEDIAQERMARMGNLDESGRRRDHARYLATLQGQALRKKQYQEFLDSMHPNTDISAQRTSPSATSSAAGMLDDWCDYSLDKEKIHAFMIGEPTKDPLDFNYSWVNEKDDRVQTKNLNGNPNGSGTGNWTVQVNDHCE